MAKAKRVIPEWIQEHLPAELVDSTLFRFEVQLQVIESRDDSGKPKYKSLTVDMLPDLELDYENLESQMTTLPSQYIFWSSIYSELRLGVSVADRKLKARKGKVIDRIISEAALARVKLTSDQVKAIAEADSDLKEAELRYERAQMYCGKVYHMVEAIKMKMDLARSLAGFKRAEQERN